MDVAVIDRALAEIRGELEREVDMDRRFGVDPLAEGRELALAGAALALCRVLANEERRTSAQPR